MQHAPHLPNTPLPTNTQVFFTVSASVYDADAEPTVTGVALKLAACVGLFLVPIAPLLIVGGGIAMGVTSVRGTSMAGVFADARAMVVTGIHKPNGEYMLLLSAPSRDAPPPPPADLLMVASPTAAAPTTAAPPAARAEQAGLPPLATKHV